MKIVLNKCHGGFGLSEAAIRKLREWGYEPPDDERNGYQRYVEGWRHACEILDKKDAGEKIASWALSLYDIPRNHPLLVRVVEELGDKANGMCAKLEVEDIQWHWEDMIQNHDGNEWFGKY